MPRSDRTTMGGDGESFETTQWTRILEARGDDPQRRQQAIATILGQYWKPVYCYLRRKGFHNEKAKDLTQGFFCRIVLENQLIQQGDRDKGRFRTFLLTALDRYTVNIARAEHAQKRMPRQRLLSLDGANLPDLPEPGGQATPEQAFNYTWAASLLEDVLAEVEAGCRTDGLDKHWQVFEATVVQSARSGERTVSMRSLCESLGIESEAKVSNMGVTVKRRFQAALRRRVRRSVQSDQLVDEELAEIMRILSSGRAG